MTTNVLNLIPGPREVFVIKYKGQKKTRRRITLWELVISARGHLQSGSPYALLAVIIKVCKGMVTRITIFLNVTGVKTRLDPILEDQMMRRLAWRMEGSQLRCTILLWLAPHSFFLSLDWLEVISFIDTHLCILFVAIMDIMVGRRIPLPGPSPAWRPTLLHLTGWDRPGFGSSALPLDLYNASITQDWNFCCGLLEKSEEDTFYKQFHNKLASTSHSMHCT